MGCANKFIMREDNSVQCEVYMNTRIKHVHSNNATVLFLVTIKLQKFTPQCKGSIFAMLLSSNVQSNKWIIGVILYIDYINKSILFQTIKREKSVNIYITPEVHQYQLCQVSSFFWVNQVTGSFLGSIIDTVSYINIYDQCYDMNTNGPDVVKVHDHIASNLSYNMINVH